MRPRLFVIIRLLVAMAIGIGCVSGISCRRRMSSAELDALREGMARETELQQTASDKRDRIWEDVEGSFDHDEDGQLNSSERAAFDDYLTRVRQGRVPNPFLSEAPSHTP